MANEQAMHSRKMGDGGGLGSSAVEAFSGLFPQILEVSGLVVEKVYSFDIIRNPLVKEGVGGVGVGFCLCGGLGDGLVLDKDAILPEIAFAPFQAIEKRGGNFVLTGFFRVDAAERADLAEAKAPAFYPVIDGKTADLEFGFPNDNAISTKRMKVEGVGQLDVGDPELQPDDPFEGCRRIDVQILGSAEQPHTGEEADEPEIMVTMKMGDKNVIDLAAADLVFGHLHLGTFAAVDQKDLVFHGDNLGRGMTVKGGQSGVIT